MKARITANNNLRIFLEPDDDCRKGECCEYVLEKLCKEHDCELIGRPYSIGGDGYQAQDIMSRQSWCWYSMEFKEAEYKLYYLRNLKLFYKRLTPEMMIQQGYPADKESLRAMGLFDIGGKIAVRRRGNAL